MATSPINFTILLRQINKLRNAADGMEPIAVIPQGITQDASECPIARALSNGVRAEVDLGEITFFYPTASFVEDDIVDAVNRIKKAGFIVGLWCCSIGGMFWEVSVKPTQTMKNFIVKFDSEELTDYIQGWEGSY